jgi:hypothetical protein
MKLPFTPEQFFAVFSAYNEAVWPAQIGLLAIALLALAAIALRHRLADRFASAVLATLWAWIGAVYHLGFFAAINPPAIVFGALSLAGAALLAWHGVVRQRLRFRLSAGWRGIAGITLIAFALLGYPLWTALTGHAYPAFPTFGLPCPTALFTIGVLALLRRPHPRAPLAVPVLWSLVGSQAALLLGVTADLGLLAAAAMGIVLIAIAGRLPTPACR